MLRVIGMFAALCLTIGTVGTSSAATIDFSRFEPGPEMPYRQSGFTVRAQDGFFDPSPVQIRRNLYEGFDRFAASPRPSGGFGNGFGHRLIITNDSGLPFGLTSLDVFRADPRSDEQETIHLVVSGRRAGSPVMVPGWPLRLEFFQDFTTFVNDESSTRLFLLDELTISAEGGRFVPAVVSNIVLAPIPLPVPVLMLLGGLAMLGGLAVHRRAA
ncbi:hypothetical protein BH23PSE1_BH23PSE1_14890 [soil metagenome]